MKIARVMTDTGPSYAIVEDDTVFLASGDPFSGLSKGERAGSVDEVSWLTPVQPRMILAIGMNYAAHVTEIYPDREPPEEPRVFVKTVSSLLPHNGYIELPPGDRIDFEAELCVVIGRTASRVKRANALDYVLGYTCGNDVSHRDHQKVDGPMLRGKGIDTFCPLGPVIETDLNPENLRIQSRQNGEIRQNSSTDDLLFDVPHLIEFCSYYATLVPGDVIMTGSPAGVSPMSDGDVIEVEIEGIGTLRNPVRDRPE